MNSIENNNFILYLKSENELKALRRIQKSIGRNVKIKDLRQIDLLTEINSARSIGKKSLDLLIKYIDLDTNIVNDNLNRIKQNSTPRYSKQYYFYRLLTKLNLKESRNNLERLIKSKKEFNISELTRKEIEFNIIKNIDNLLVNLNDRERIIFSSYYGYKTKVCTLEETATELAKFEKKGRITRERVRQLVLRVKGKILENNIFNLKDLIKYLEKIQNQGFHVLFPELDKLFTDTVKTKKLDISGDRLNQFLADFTGKDYDYYKTPEVILKNNFDKDQLNEIFLEQPYGINEDLFHSEVKTLFGFDDLGVNSAIKYMDDNNLIIHKNNKIYPLTLTGIEEVAHICLKFPKGIFWRDIYEILNNSPSKNSFPLDRLIADHKVGDNIYLWLCAKGTHKHINYLKHKENKNEIIKSVYDILLKKNTKALRLTEVYNYIKSNKLLKNFNLDYHELRAFIKIYGKEKGIFWKGRSSVDTISLNKNFNYLKNKDNILDIINKSSTAIHEKQIIKLMDRGTDIKNLISLHGEELLKEKKVMRVGPKLWYNYDKSLKLCDINLLKEETNKLFIKYNTISLHYITNYLNTKLKLALSYYYYDSIFETMDKDLKLFFYNSYISINNEKFTSEKIYKNYFQDNLNLDENVKYLASAHKIAISPQQFINAKYNYV